MWKALNATGRPILYSLSNWGEDYVHTVSPFLLILQMVQLGGRLDLNHDADERSSGECLLQIRGEYRATYMIRLLGQTHFVVVMMRKIRTALRQVGLHVSAVPIKRTDNPKVLTAPF